MNSFSRIHTFANRQTQRGLSLIELMISITIGLLILSALSTLFVNQSRTRSELDKSNRMIDNGRYALELLSDNLKLAGFYDNFMPSGTPATAPDPCTVPTTSLDVLLHHVQGYNAATATATASPPAACVTAGLTSLNPGSDILVLRRASTSTPVAAAAAVAATTYLQVSNCSTDTSGSYQIAPGTAAFTAFHKKNCTDSGPGVDDGPATLRPFIVQVYFVSPDNNTGDGIPTLKRMEFNPATGAIDLITPLVEGIEYMQIDYGLDTDADGVANSYIDAPALANWPNIVSIKINIIARNTEATTGYTDTKTYALGIAGNFGPFNAAPYNAAPYPVTYPTLANYKRHAYTQVVRLVNPSSRREVP